MNSALTAIQKALLPFRRYMPGGDAGLALCVLFQLSILILPIPTALLVSVRELCESSESVGAMGLIWLIHL
jgi:hypothetical protein